MYFHLSNERTIMKTSFALALLAAAASTEAFQPIASPKPSATTTSLFAKDDCKQGDMSAECLLSEQELKHFSGKANTDLHKGDAKLALELEDIKGRIQQLEADIAAGKFSNNNAEDDCAVNDPRIECMLSDLEKKWVDGQAFVENEVMANLELQNLKDKSRALAKELRDDIRQGAWEKLNKA